MSADAQIRSALHQMEDDIFAVELFARLLGHFAGNKGMIEAECLYALSDPLLQVGFRLREQFREAFSAAGGRL
ncbi:hypothetical protein [Methylobacterium thuringiense]|uniref:Uncharacterized protein n=1 Tax=Methylobacterium thuringiense TaxID=1003091 RepID=A0ABQ4TPW6_9HYPH|nr:hypothetical protein [Methylobacterium thuringiense]GJE57403.1 hypothetical protein EKPJFOCH_3917 [Methylobacterium thuringiense]